MNKLYVIAVLPSGYGEANYCKCDNVGMGSYANQVELTAPQFMKVHLFNRGQNTSTVCVDACLKNEILSLWEREIMTTGCCCGHNKQAGYIGVYRIGDVQKMKELGYVLLPEAEETFYPKSLPKHLIHPDLKPVANTWIEEWEEGYETFDPVNGWELMEVTKKGFDQYPYQKRIVLIPPTRKG